MGPHKSIYQIACKSIKRFKQGARIRQTTDRYINHFTEKCVAIGGITCDKAISLINNNSSCVGCDTFDNAKSLYSPETRPYG